MEPRDILKKFTNKYRARLLLQADCDLNCEICHPVCVTNCWISNLPNLAKEFPNEMLQLVPNMSHYSLSHLVSKLTGIKLDQAFAESEESLRAKATELLQGKTVIEEPKREEPKKVSGELIIPLEFWFSNDFKNLTVFQRMVLLECLAISIINKSDTIVLPISYLTERLNTTNIVVSSLLDLLVSRGYLERKENDIYKIKLEEVSHESTRYKEALGTSERTKEEIGG